jgi:hypothetical protein
MLAKHQGFAHKDGSQQAASRFFAHLGDKETVQDERCPAPPVPEWVSC